MKSNKLEQIKQCLIKPHPELEIQLNDDTIKKANQSLIEMFKYA